MHARIREATARGEVVSGYGSGGGHGSGNGNGNGGTQ